jgi:hypothetical protein
MDKKCIMLLFLRNTKTLLPRLLGPALVGLLALAILSPVFSADASVLHTVVKTTISVKEACAGSAVDASVVVKDQAGNIIVETTVGTQVSIEGTVFIDCVNYIDGEPQITFFEVRDEEGMTTFLAWQRISEYSDGQIVANQSWTPDESGEYEVRLFSPVCLRCPMVLNNVVTYEIRVS